eukprot:TRINITY_DN22315_c0_g1_i1.p1 TRINITY_DN22315_c0_g1~~TRINITY_DN22315_c0_g1_i1.p1  ORF type:complete len:416 (+),score=104.06 TRINITY_DN22315_c0_g1_i1:319-1566(+)
MNNQDKQQITHHLTALIDRTEFDSHLETKLLERGIFTESMLERIKNGDKNTQKRNLFLEVKRRGPNAFKNLVNALSESGNTKAARLLDPEIPEEDDTDEKNSKVWNTPNYQETGSNGNPENSVSYVQPPVLENNTKPLEIKVEKTASNVTKTHGTFKTYKMDSKPRGLVLIIDNENFDNEVLPTRTGSLVDANNLDILFGQLGFRVTLRRNLPYYDMITEIQKFASKTDHALGDMAIVAILSHGRHGLIAAADGRELETEWVLRQFNNDGCPALKGKPKFFIFQACRGDEADYGILPAISFPENRSDSDARAVVMPRQPVEIPSESQFKNLSWEDMVVAYATLPGYVANRDRYRGTWFIECLCSVFMEMSVELDLRDMLDIVAERLEKYESEMGTKQSFAYEVRHFYKKLYFNPN